MAESEREEANVTDDLALDLVRLIRRESRPIEPIPPQYPFYDNLESPVRAVLFDVYGTLFVSASGDISLHAVENRNQNSDAFGPVVSALRAAGCNVLDAPNAEQVGRSEYLAVIEAIHAEKRKLGIAFPEVDIVEVWSAVFDELNGSGLILPNQDPTAVYRAAVTYECLTNPVWPMPGAAELLGRIAQTNIPVGLISNAQFYTPLLFPALFERTLADLGVDDCLCNWSYRRGVAKPALRLFETVREVLLRNYAVAPENVLYIGNDMLNDILPAQQAGFSTCLFAGDSRSLRLREEEPRCAHLRPDSAVGTLAQLSRVLDLTTTIGKEHG